MKERVMEQGSLSTVQIQRERGRERVKVEHADAKEGRERLKNL